MNLRARARGGRARKSRAPIVDEGCAGRELRRNGGVAAAVSAVIVERTDEGGARPGDARVEMRGRAGRLDEALEVEARGFERDRDSGHVEIPAPIGVQRAGGGRQIAHVGDVAGSIEIGGAGQDPRGPGVAGIRDDVDAASPAVLV